MKWSCGTIVILPCLKSDVPKGIMSGEIPNVQQLHELSGLNGLNLQDVNDFFDDQFALERQIGIKHSVDYELTVKMLS